MSIKTKIIILAIFSLVVTTTIGLILFQNSLTVTKEIEKQTIVSEIRADLLERVVLRADYLLHHEKRPTIQLQRLSEVLEKLFLQLSPTITLADEQISLKKLRDNSNSVNQTFSQIVANSSTTSASSPRVSSKELEERLVSQILIKSQGSLVISAQLADASRHRVIESQNITTTLVLVFLTSAIVIILLALFFIWFSIAKPLIALKESALRIASLDFSSTTTGKNSNDEIGQLGRAFDQIVVKLREAYQTLETKVRDRTQDLEEIKAKDEAILFSIGDAVMACNKDGLVMLFNGVAEKLTGFSIKEVTGHHYNQTLKFVRESDEKTGEDFIAEAIKTGQGTKMANHTLLITKGGQKIPVADSAAPIKNTKGQIIGCVLVFRDMTKDRKIDKAKTEFVSLASHQLRTPLGIMKWYLEVLNKEDYIQQAPKVTQEYFNEVYKNNERVLSLVRNLLSVSRIDQGRVKDAPKPVNILEIITDTVKQMQILAKSKKVTLHLQLKAQKLPKFYLDPLRFHEVIENLVANAIEYTQALGKVEVKVDEQNSSPNKNNDAVIISIQDTGMGISVVDKSKLFDKFFRAPEAIKNNPEGSGLGLYVVKSYVEEWGGKISVESVEGKGSTFSISLPISGKNPPSRKATAGEGG